jgi:hypothetical protein
MKRSLAVIAIIVCAVVAVAEGVRSQGYEPGENIVALNQGWSASEADHFWYASQGTQLMPAAWLRALRNPGGSPIMSPANLERLGFQDVHARPSALNPHGWPIGLVVSKIGGIEAAGFTCAACHTGELTYKGTTMRVEGGSTSLNVGAFSTELYNAVVAIKRDPALRARFMKEAIAYGYPPAHIERDFDREAAHADVWLLNTSGLGGTSVIPGPGRIDALTGIANREFAYDLRDPHNVIRGTAPSSYPELWDIWRLDWVQYNTSVRSPMGRNVGESLGVGVRTNIVDAAGKLNPEPLRWESSLRVHNLYEIEEQLSHLKSPVWPANVLGDVDSAQSQRGRALFDQTCSRCHGISQITGTAPTEWAVHTIPYKVIGTDPDEVLMFAGSRFDGSIVGLSKSTPGGLGIAEMTGHLLGAAYKEAGITTPALIAQYNGWGRTGYATAPCGYKARPLVGVWATPPFLHNGSVPSVYDLLSDTRPAHPILGNSEYDPDKLGTVQEATSETLTLDTASLGNSNKGHWFTNDTTRPGRIGPALTEAQKYDIIGYLKIASYDNYPTTTVAGEYSIPCDKDFDWADGKVVDLHINAR